MTMEEREGALVITRLPIEQMGLLTLGWKKGKGPGDRSGI